MRIARLSEALAEQGVRVSVLLDRSPFNCGPDLDIKPTVERVYVDWGHRLSRAANRRRILAELKPDFTHVLSPSLGAMLTFLGSGQTRLVADWDEWPARRRHVSVAERTMYKVIDWWLQRRAALCIVASKAMQGDFQKQFGKQPLYLPHASFIPDFPEGVSPHSEPTAVYMGNFFSFYDHDILFDAARILKQRGLRPRIEMIAGGPDIEKWRLWAKQEQLDNVTFAGYLQGETLYRHLRHAHVLLFPLRESDVNRYRCPGKLLIYAQVKRPTILTDVGECRAVMGEAGIYVEPTGEDFALAIEKAMSQPRPLDVEYDTGTWSDLAKTLLNALPPNLRGAAQ